MSKKDEALTLPPPKSTKGPTAEDLKALSVQKAWLEKHINWKALRRIAHVAVGEVATGSDLVQELFNDMLQWAPEELEGVWAPQDYATKAIHNRVLNWRRRFRHTDPLPQNAASIPDHMPPMEEALVSPSQVVELFAKMPKAWVGPWVLYKVYGYKHEETAQKLGLTLDAVKKRVRNADDFLETLATRPTPLSALERIGNFIQRKERRRDK
jgi:DNA-directed RNA polymerase specialized sigma24 family protein